VNNANEAQTRNPQSDVGGNLQPNVTNLQPVVGANQSGSLNPQLLPQTNSLRVLTTTGQKSIPSNDAPPPGGISPWVSPIVGIFLFVLLLLAARSAKPAEELAKAKETKSKESGVLKDKIIEPSLLVSQKKKKQAKKKNKKKRR
jgi:hypothetical protein